MIFILRFGSPFTINRLRSRSLMKTSRPIVALALAALVAGAGCARVRAKMAFKDGNKDYKEENFKRSVDDYQRAVTYDPNFSEAWFYLGSSHQAQFRPGKDTPENKAQLEAAIEAFKKSLETNPGQTDKQKLVKRNTLAALTAIYSDEPFKNFEEAQKYAQQLVADSPNDSKSLYALANLYEKFDKIPEAEAIYKKVADQNAKDAKACGALAAFYNKPNWDEQGNPWVAGSNKPRLSRFDQAIAVLEKCAAIDPNDASGYQKVASYYWDKAYRDPLLSDEQKNAYAEKGMQNVDKALQLKPDYFDAVIYKGLLYRVKASAASNPRQKAEFLEKAQELQKQGLELKKQQAAEQAPAAGAASPAGQ
jgi:tetratricopeptide (TPR) repeat protein